MCNGTAATKTRRTITQSGVHEKKQKATKLNVHDSRSMEQEADK
jgi:hypothetical protein